MPEKTNGVNARQAEELRRLKEQVKHLRLAIGAFFAVVDRRQVVDVGRVVSWWLGREIPTEPKWQEIVGLLSCASGLDTASNVAFNGNIVSLMDGRQSRRCPGLPKNKGLHRPIDDVTFGDGKDYVPDWFAAYIKLTIGLGDRQLDAMAKNKSALTHESDVEVGER